jgi:23S rRNA pseudouridine1911/1915/1917 synthase
LSANIPQPASIVARRRAANAVTLRVMSNPVPGSGKYTVTIPLEMAGMRLDQALAKLMPHESRSRLAKLIEDGHVLVDGAAMPGRRKVKSGEAVEVALVPRPAQEAYKAEAIDLAVVHEDEDVLVIDKPAGLVVHPGSGNWEGTMLNALLHRVPALAHLPRAGIVHRLDKDTSGLLVVAKSEAAQQSLVRQLQDRSVKRTYLALARGRVVRDGTVDSPIGRHPVQRTKMAVVEAGKPAVTHYRVRERFVGHTLLECDLETGRTHQIRVHLASIGHALEGDAAYAGRGAKIFGRQALHAWKLAFDHPRTGQRVSFESKLPSDFANLLRSLAP